MVAIGFIFWLVNLLLIMIFNLFMKAFQNFMNNIMQSLIIDPKTLNVFELSYVRDLMGHTIWIGIALLAVIGSYQGFKVFFTYFGFTPDDEPRMILFRSAFLAFLIANCQSLISFIFGLYGGIANATFGLMHGKTLSSMMFLGAFGVVGGVTMFFQVEMALAIYIVFKMITMLIKFAERYCLMIIIVIFMPMAMACLASRGTREIGVAYFKLFFGNLVVQYTQIVCVVLIYSMAQVNPAKPGDWKNLFLVIGFLLIIEKIDDLINVIALQTGFNSMQLDPMRSTILNPLSTLPGALGNYTMSAFKNNFNTPRGSGR